MNKKCGSAKVSSGCCNGDVILCSEVPGPLESGRMTWFRLWKDIYEIAKKNPGKMICSNCGLIHEK